MENENSEVELTENNKLADNHNKTGLSDFYEIKFKYL